jgi:superfamily I DNA and/or RNA helicase
MISDKIKSAEEVIRRLQGSRLMRFDAYTIDSYQGQEADVVIFSPVRSNENENKIGHTGDYRRLNVAISRAKRGLIVAGNAQTLITSPVYREGVRVKNYWPE